MQQEFHGAMTIHMDSKLELKVFVNAQNNHPFTDVRAATYTFSDQFTDKKDMRLRIIKQIITCSQKKVHLQKKLTNFQ